MKLVWRASASTGFDMLSPPNLVGRGDLLQAQQRLGHRDASTTLRNYAHAMPLEDQAVADDIDEMLRTRGNLQAAPAPVSNRANRETVSRMMGSEGGRGPRREPPPPRRTRTRAWPFPILRRALDDRFDTARM
jgi:hypothetical protein